jgi:hypothetical protein
MQNGYRHPAKFGPPSWTPIMDPHYEPPLWTFTIIMNTLLNYIGYPANLKWTPAKFEMNTCKI